MLGYNGFIQETEDAAALALGRNGWIQPTEEQGAPPAASVVPASQVVASTREDESLDRAGLVSAIAALPASGGDVYIGAGGLAIDLTAGPIVIDRDVRLFGAGIGNTVVTCSGDGVLFELGNFNFTVEDIQFMGDSGTSDQIFLSLTASHVFSNTTIFMNRVGIGTSYDNAAGAFRVIIDQNSFTRSFVLSDCFFNVFCSDHTLDFFIKDSSSASTYRITNVNAVTGAQITGYPTIYSHNFTCNALFGAQTIQLGFTVSSGGSYVTGVGGSVAGNTGTTQKASGTTFGGGTVTSESVVFDGCTVSGTVTIKDGELSGCTVAACTLGDQTNETTVTATGCNFTGAINADWDGVKLSNCRLTTFTANGFGSHTIDACTFANGGIDNVILDNSNGNVVTGNLNCRVIESGTVTNNYYTNILSTSTLIGPSSVVGDSQEEEIEVSYSNVASSTYGTSGLRYSPLAKVANPNEEYIQIQFQAMRIGRLRLKINYAPSVSNGGDVVFVYTGSAIDDGGAVDGALSALLTDTFTPGAGATMKQLSIDTTLDVTPGETVTIKILRDDVAGDTHTGSMNILGVKAWVW